MKKTPGKDRVDWRQRSWPSLPPNINRAKPPGFHQMDSECFEEMTCALLDKEDGIAQADLYHVRFEQQFGIDCFGDAADGLHVASSKSHGIIKKGQIARWSDDFLDHWEGRWRSHGVARFILAIAVTANSRARLNEIRIEKARFAALGVRYEVWTARHLQARLRDHKGIVSQYLGLDWVKTICGMDVTAPASSAQQIPQVFLEARIETLSHALAGSVEERLDIAEAGLERGLLDEADRAASAITRGAGWTDLGAGLQSRTLRLKSRLALVRGHADAAVRLNGEADRLEPPIEPRLKAQIALRQGGPAAGLAALGTPSTDKGRLLKASMLMAAGELDAAANAMAALPETGERLRLGAILALCRGLRDDAASMAARAIHAAPDNPAVLRAHGMVLYARTLSKLAQPQYYVVPNPVASTLVRQDDASRADLHAALRTFEDMLRQQWSEQRSHDQLWALACLCNLPGRHDDASARAGTILAEHPDDLIAIGWALARGLAVNLEASRRALEAKAKAGGADLDTLRVLSWLGGATTGGLAGTGAGEPDPEQGRLRRLSDAFEKGDADGLIAEFERTCAHEPGSPFVIGAAHALAKAQRWDVLGRHAQALAGFETADAIRLAAYAAANSGDMAKALEVLAAGRRHFAGDRLPHDLRRLEMDAMTAEGDLAAAVRLASVLATETGAANDFVRAAKLQLRAGSRAGAAEAIRIAFSRQGLKPIDAVGWARTLAPQDIELARALWRFAADEAGSDEELAAAVMIASFELGLENERPDLMQAVVRLAETEGSGISAFTIDDLPSILGDDQARVRQAVAGLRQGDLPVHLCVKPMHANLAELYWLPPEGRTTLRPLLMRSGARSESGTTPVHAGKVILDVTAFLIASQLDLLGLMRASGRELLTVPSTAPALLSMEQELRHHQPRRVGAARKVLEEAGRRITVGGDAFSRVGLDVGEGTFGLAQVVSAMEAADWIDGPTADDARKAMNLQPAEGGPPPGTPLLFGDRTLEAFADAGLLDPLLDAYGVHTDAASLREARAELEREERRHELLTWLACCRKELSDSLLDGRMKLVRLAPGDTAAQLGDVPEVINLGEMLRAQGSEGCLWIDDRHINSHGFAGSRPIVGVVDVLQALRAEGRLDEMEYHRKLARLRAAGALFIPFSIDEVWHPLEKAVVVEGELGETPRLRNIRRGAAHAALHLDCLRPFGSAGNGRPDEAAFLLSLRRIADEVIVRSWKADTAPEVAAARATWAWRSLRLEAHPPQLLKAETWQAELPAALNIASVICDVLQIFDAGGQSGRERRSSFLAWVEREVIGTRLSEDEPLSKATADYARQMLLPRNLQQPGSDEEGLEVVRNLIRALVVNLPDKIGSLLAAEEGFLPELGLQGQTSLQIDGKSFDAAEFWKAVGVACREGSSKVTSIGGEVLDVARSASGTDAFRFHAEATDFAITAPEGVFSADADAAGAAFSELLRQVDAPQAEMHGLTARFGEAGDEHGRMRLVEAVSERSIPGYLAGLGRAVRDDTKFALSLLLPPPAADWLRHLRWPEGQGADVFAMIGALAAEVGEREALERVVGLPVALPAAMGQALAVEATHLTFMGEVHRTKALRDGGASQEDLADASARMTQAFADSGKLFVACLRWGSGCFATQAGWPRITATQKHALTWIFAERVTRSILEGGADGDHLARTLAGRRPPRNAARMLSLDPAFDGAPLHAGWIQPPALLLAGLEHALGPSGHVLQANDAAVEQLTAEMAPPDEDGVTRPFPVRALAFAASPFATWMSRPTPEAVLPDGAAAERLLDEAVAALEEDPHQASLWHAIAIFGQPCLEPALASRASNLVERLDLASVMQGDHDPFLTMAAIAAVGTQLARPPQGDRILHMLFGISGRWFDEHHWKEGCSMVPGYLNVAAVAATATGADGAKRLAGFLRLVFAKWPAVGQAARPFLEALVSQTPVKDAAGLWEALLAARAS